MRSVGPLIGNSHHLRLVMMRYLERRQQVWMGQHSAAAGHRDLTALMRAIMHACVALHGGSV